MEEIYFYESKNKSDVDELTKDDVFMKVDLINKDAAASGTSKKSGFFLYIKSSDPKEFEAIDKKIAEVSEKKGMKFIEKADSADAKTIIDNIRKEAEEAAEGMGSIFG
jgi:hypothetical protein